MGYTQFTAYGLLSRVGLIAGLCLAMPAFAQWPTSYMAPKVIGTGTTTRAGDVMATPDGGAVTVIDQIIAGTHKPTAALFNSEGEKQSVAFGMSSAAKFISEITLLPASPALFGAAVQYVEKNIQDQLPIFYYEAFNAEGDSVPYDVSSFWQAYSGSWICYDAQLSFGNQLVGTFYNPWAGQFGIMSFSSALPPTLGDLNPGERIDNAVLLPFSTSSALGCFTKSGPQTDTPTELWLTYFQASGEASSLDTLDRVADESGSQSDPQFTDMGSGNAMLTWISSRDGERKLRAKIVTYTGDEVSGAQDTIENVTGYIAINTTLGLPVFAAVQQDATVYPPVDTLVGGLLNPSNGGTLSIPIASAPGVKVKALQQESNGDFSLVYSIPEGGTNLLKVRRISGVTAGTLWETTVADLGLASEDVIGAHPNTWVSGNVDGVLYILARYDQPGTANSSFQLVRLRADGTMGAD